MIHFSESFEKFLVEADSRIAHILFNVRYSSHPAWQLYVTNKNIDYLAHREDGTISFLPAGKEHKVNDAGRWSREGRQNGKPAKVLRKVFTDRALKLIKQSEFEKFGNQYKASFCVDGFEFKLLPSSEIGNVYCHKPRHEGGASLNNSCMNGDRSYLGIYRDKQIQIITLWKEDKLAGRALVWTIDDKVIMDRIYVSCDYMYDMFIGEAERNGWYYKVLYSSYESPTKFINTKTGETETLRLTVKLETEDQDQYPYIDTFRYGGYGWLSNDSSTNYNFEYVNTDGTRDGDDNSNHDDEDSVWDDINEESIHVDDSNYIDSGERRFRGRTTRREDVVWIGENTYHRQDSGICEVTIGNRSNRGWALVENCGKINGSRTSKKKNVL